MKTREQIAADLYNFGRDSVMQGGDSLQMLAKHIPAMVYGVKGNDGALWQDRAFPDKTVHLDRFEDYLLKPAREGLGIPSLLWLSRVLDAHEDKDEREKALAALRQEIPDFDARVEKERARASVKVEAAKMRGGNNNPEGKNQHTVADLVASVDPVKAHGGVAGQDSNSTLSIDQPKRQKRDAAYWIARLKRDAATDTIAASLLSDIESGNIRPYRAAIRMGYVQPPNSVQAIIRSINRLTHDELMTLMQQLAAQYPLYFTWHGIFERRKEMTT